MQKCGAGSNIEPRKKVEKSINTGVFGHSTNSPKFNILPNTDGLRAVYRLFIVLYIVLEKIKRIKTPYNVDIMRRKYGKYNAYILTQWNNKSIIINITPPRREKSP